MKTYCVLFITICNRLNLSFSLTSQYQAPLAFFTARNVLIFSDTSNVIHPSLLRECKYDCFKYVSYIIISNCLLAISISYIYRILTVHFPQLLSIFHRLDRNQCSTHVQAVYKYFVTCKFLDAFGKLLKETTNVVVSVFPSVHMEQLGSH